MWKLFRNLQVFAVCLSAELPTRGSINSQQTPRTRFTNFHSVSSVANPIICYSPHPTTLRYLVTLPFSASHPFQQPAFPFPSHKRPQIIKFLYHPFQPFFHIFTYSHSVSFIWKCTKHAYVEFILFFPAILFSLLQIIRGHANIVVRATYKSVSYALCSLWVVYLCW